jgi:hypothetical protein
LICPKRFVDGYERLLTDILDVCLVAHAAPHETRYNRANILKEKLKSLFVAILRL